MLRFLKIKNYGTKVMWFYDKCQNHILKLSYFMTVNILNMVRINRNYKIMLGLLAFNMMFAFTPYLRKIVLFLINRCFSYELKSIKGLIVYKY